MSLRIYNTLTGKKETFTPLEEGKAGMYVCGPTVYDSSHIGHARSVVVFDVVFRWLKRSGYDVCYVRNFTDVDDKIINKANSTGMKCDEVSEKYIKDFHDDMDALGVLRPTMEPRATDHIKEIIDFIQLLIDRDKAYYVPGSDVFFSIDSFADYGRLSGRKPDDMVAGSRIAVDENKRNPRDFTLWKPAKPGEPSWESPWGAGRPGWHIECSAMSYKYLGKSFDIHGGGKDLIFPHHENEIAQSQAAFDQPFVKYWIHNGFVDINNEKMSKSLGNFTMIKEVLDRYHPEVIRMFLLSKHYRSPIDYSDTAMDEVISGLDRIYAFLQRAIKAGAADPGDGPLGEDWNAFKESMDDDFNTARAMATIFETIKNGNRIMDKAGDTLTEEALSRVGQACRDLKHMGEIMGIGVQDPDLYFKNKKDSALARTDLDPQKIDSLVMERTQARKSRDFARADEIREELDRLNIILEDSPEGTTWKLG